MTSLMKFNKNSSVYELKVNNSPFFKSFLKKLSQQATNSQKIFPNYARAIFLCRNLDKLNSIHLRERIE